MSALSLDIATAFRLGGFIYLVMPATVWFVLNGKHERTSLIAWCAGASAYGLAYLLIGYRGVLPDGLTIHVANTILFATYPLRVAALRLEMGARPRWSIGLLLLGLATAAFWWADAVSAPLRVSVSTFLQLLGTAWLTWTAARVWQLTGSRSARMIAWAYAVFVVMILWAALQTQLGGGALIAARPDAGNLVFTVMTGLTVMTGFVAALYGNLGYMGMALERAHRHEVAQAEALAHESAERLVAEQHASQLRDWLDEREELLRLLAHEVRQPLNNATAALQAAHSALDPGGTDSIAARQRVQRAEVVLGQIIGTLDNTLAATALLASPDKVERRDVDVDTLLALGLGDLGAAQRPRVRIEKVAHTRTATMDSGLMRLALRNLLSNALAYSPPDSAVLLRVTDSDEPLALVFEVVDQGKGVAPALAGRLFERGIHGDHGASGHGLGLYVVRRVMELHGGSVDVRQNPAESGAVFRLTLPQDLADGGAPFAPQAARNSARKV